MVGVVLQAALSSNSKNTGWDFWHLRVNLWKAPPKGKKGK